MVKIIQKIIYKLFFLQLSVVTGESLTETEKTTQLDSDSVKNKGTNEVTVGSCPIDCTEG